jgi:folate-binding protein YgfZ
LSIRGKDRVTWLNGLLTCDVAKVTAEQGAYGLLVEKKGKISSDLFVLGGEGELVLVTPAAEFERVLAVLDHHLIMEDVELDPCGGAVVFLHGPRARTLVDGVARSGNVTITGLGDALWIAETEEEPRRAAERFGAAFSTGVESAAVWSLLRVECGVPELGIDFDSDNYPQEASLETLAVSFDKGCYLGQEVVYMLEHRGHAKKRVVLLRSTGDGPLERGAKVADATGAEVGRITSSVYSAYFSEVRSLASVKSAAAHVGTELRAGERVATVIPARESARG